MPKSKLQKQTEALQRKRNMIPLDRGFMLRYQQGGDFYASTLHYFGKDRADEEADRQRKKFVKICDEAKVDTHGNPL